MRRLKAALLGLWLLLGGCAHAPAAVAAGKCPVTPRWTLGVVVVYVDLGMSKSCLAATAEAILWWRAQGATYLAPLGSPAGWEPGPLQSGYISITSGALPPGVAGSTVPGYLERSGDMVFARITIDPTQCYPQVVAHELGHALGLSIDGIHNPARGTLMYYSTDGIGWGLTDCERNSIRGVVGPDRIGGR